MKTFMCVVLFAMSAAAAAAQTADTERRTYADPACAARDVDPARCVVRDGDSRIAVVGETAPPENPPPTGNAKSGGSAFTSKGGQSTSGGGLGSAGGGLGRGAK